MAGSISAVNAGGSGVSKAQLEAEIQAAVLGKQKEVLEDQGEQQVQLIQQALSAGGAPQGRLDISV